MKAMQAHKMIHHLLIYIVKKIELNTAKKKEKHEVWNQGQNPE